MFLSEYFDLDNEIIGLEVYHLNSDVRMSIELLGDPLIRQRIFFTKALCRAKSSDRRSNDGS